MKQIQGQYVKEGKNGKPQVRVFSGLNRHDRRKLAKLNKIKKKKGIQHALGNVN